LPREEYRRVKLAHWKLKETRKLAAMKTNAVKGGVEVWSFKEKSTAKREPMCTKKLSLPN